MEKVGVQPRAMNKLSSRLDLSMRPQLVQNSVLMTDPKIVTELLGIEHCHSLYNSFIIEGSLQ